VSAVQLQRESATAALALRQDAASAAGVARGYTVGDLCRRWRVGADKVHAWLRRGELVAVNVASSLAGRPLWRVTPEEVECFERRRCSAPPPKTERRRRMAAVMDYYP
jgi:hypothetical protein